MVSNRAQRKIIEFLSIVYFLHMYLFSEFEWLRQQQQRQRSQNTVNYWNSNFVYEKWMCSAAMHCVCAMCRQWQMVLHNSVCTDRFERSKSIAVCSELLRFISNATSHLFSISHTHSKSVAQCNFTIQHSMALFGGIRQHPALFTFFAHKDR